MRPGLDTRRSRPPASTTVSSAPRRSTSPAAHPPRRKRLAAPSTRLGGLRSRSDQRHLPGSTEPALKRRRTAGTDARKPQPGTEPSPGGTDEPPAKLGTQAENAGFEPSIDPVAHIGFETGHSTALSGPLPAGHEVSSQREVESEILSARCAVAPSNQCLTAARVNRPRTPRDASLRVRCYPADGFASGS
jgi:hypothetical protein